jgi:NTE family protein
VITGNFVYFDNAHEQIEPGVMGSGALPPALPMVKIGTDWRHCLQYTVATPA